MNTHTIHKIAFSLILGGTLSVASSLVMAVTTTPGITISQIPLSTGASGVVPNIMLMLDNSGSMDTNFTVLGTPISPTDMPSSYSFTCNTKVSGGAATAAAATTITNMIVTGTNAGTPKICTNADCSTTSNLSSSKCFDNTLYYTVKNYTTNASLGTFLGKNLNWYFSTGKFVPNNLVASATSSSITRIQMAKDAAHSLVNSLIPGNNENPTVRLGFSTYYDGLLVPISEVKKVNNVTTQADLINAQITALNTSGNTPLAEVLNDIGLYFASRNADYPAPIGTNLIATKNTTGLAKNLPSIYDTVKLTLHPGVTNNVYSINQVFHSKDIVAGTFFGDRNFNGPAKEAPIQSYCQKSAVILVSDGLPNDDREASSLLRDYTYDCEKKGLCVSTPNSLSLPGASSGTPLTATGTACKKEVTNNNGNITTPADWYNKACQNGTKAGRVYETTGSDYLDDVAAALYDIDLRPTWPSITKPTGSKNNLKTYAVGIADPVLKSEDTNGNGLLDTGEDLNGNGILDGISVLEDAARVGGGSFKYADNLAALSAALDKMVADIQKGVGSFSAIAANSSQLGADSALFQAKYDTADWTGDFIALPISSTGDILNAVWDAGEKIPAYLSRNIFTYNSGATPKGIAFNSLTGVQICAKLTPAQKTALGIISCASSDKGVQQLDYVRGDFSREQVNVVHSAAYTTANPDPRASNATQIFRNRARFWGADAIAPIKEGDLRKPDPWLLGDIVNSDPVYVSNESYGYDTLSGTKAAEGLTYNAFVTNNSNRLKMAYVGANDGFLHGFNASVSAADISSGVAGKEILAYMPNTILDKLPNLSSPDYSHLYYVDGSPSVSDVYFDSIWHTVLVGTTGTGGKGVFALDVTNPSTFDNTKVLWEVSNTDSPVVADLTTDTTALRGFKNNLGYTLPQASIGKMHDGSWAAIVANGYNSANNLGVLYIINIKTGAIIAAIDTQVSSAGLSTLFTADVDSDVVIDAVYAGDLLGNMWKFDVSSSDKTKWKVAYSAAGAPAPLYTACNDATTTASCDASRQAITNPPQVGKVGNTQTAGGVMVYFGTGKYFEDSDNLVTNTKTQSFYGVWDKCLLDFKSDGTTANTSKVASNCASTVPKTTLVQQSILAQLTPSVAIPFDVRVTSANPVDYSTKNGWYMNFVNPNPDTSVPPNPNGNNQGERIVSASLLRSGRIIFTTLIPIPPTTTTDPNALCTAGSKSTSWLMVLDAISGSRPLTPAFDINNNGSITSADVVTMTLPDGTTINASVSGEKSTGGSNKIGGGAINIKPPCVPGTSVTCPCPPGQQAILLSLGSSEFTNSQGISNKTMCEPIKSSTGTSRQSWKQL